MSGSAGSRSEESAATRRRGGTKGRGDACPADRVTPIPLDGDSWRLAREHYENFPVLSRFVPPELRDAFAAIYAFARVTDDLGDAIGASPARRLAALDQWEEGFEVALARPGDGLEPSLDGRASPARQANRGGMPDRASGTRALGGPAEAAPDPVLVRLVAVIRAHDLPVEAFRDLIRANRLDQERTRYPTWADLLDSCSLSANPVGRIVLRLFGSRDEGHWPAADAICTGLQLANHWQGIGEDLRFRDRLYVPLEERARFGVGELDLRRDRPDRRVRRLVGHLVDRTRALLEQGASLPDAFEPRRAAVLRLFLRGGRAILDEIERRPDELLRGRLRVSRSRLAILVAVEEARLRWPGWRWRTGR